jgi:hypothetical protein
MPMTGGIGRVEVITSVRLETALVGIGEGAGRPGDLRTGEVDVTGRATARGRGAFGLTRAQRWTTQILCGYSRATTTTSNRTQPSLVAYCETGRPVLRQTCRPKGP